MGKGKRVVKGALKQKYFGQPLFEKAFKCFAAMAMVCSPKGLQQEFLVDSGAVRTSFPQKICHPNGPISFKMHPSSSSLQPVGEFGPVQKP
jgi:hypothetical protein